MSGEGPRKQQFREYLYKKQDGLCYYCNKKMNFKRTRTGQPTRCFATFEHLIKKQDGGYTTVTNTVLAHRRCNYYREVFDQSDGGKRIPKGMKPSRWKAIVEVFARHKEISKILHMGDKGIQPGCHT